MNNSADRSELCIDLPEPFYKRFIKRFSIPVFISFLFFAFSFFTVIYYITGPSEGFLHSDCTDSLLWAYATVETGEIIAQDFIYAAILPFSSNLWMIPIINIFGYTMTAQIVSMVIFAILFSASLIWVFHNLRLSLALNFTASGCVLMLLSSSVKMREIMWEHVIYYSLALLLINCILSLSLTALRAWKEFCDKNEKNAFIKFIVTLVFLAIITTGTATNGIQLILMTTIPVFVGVVAEVFFNSKEKLLSTKNIGCGAVAVTLPFCSLLGLLILGHIKGDVEVWYTNYYSQLSSIENWQANLFKFHKHFLTLIGFDDTKKNFFPAEGAESIVTDTAIYNILSIAVFALLILIPIIGAFFYKKYKNKETKVAIISYLTLFLAILFLFVCGNISNVNWRLVPVVGGAMLPIFAMVNELVLSYKTRTAKETEGAEKNGSLGMRLASLIVAVFLLFSVVNISIIRKIPEDYGRNNTLHQLTEVLIEKDLTYGFATFWNSQAITLLSDSKVSCRDVNATAEDGVKIYSYQTFNRWYEPQEGVDKYFVILSGPEYMKVLRNSTWAEWTENQLIETITDVEGFYIFVFDGYLQGIK